MDEWEKTCFFSRDSSWISWDLMGDYPKIGISMGNIHGKYAHNCNVGC
jgi:hypothetical protein